MQMVDFRPGEVAQQVQAFDEVSRVFDRKASWILLANGSSDMGLSSEPVIDQKLLLLRLVMSHAGAAISTADLVIVPGQKADLTVPVGRGQSLHYQVATSVRDPNRLSLWAELQTPQGDRPLASLATTLDLRPGEKLTAGQLVTSAGPYELSIAFSRSALPEGHR
jgi:hypothetical protein